MPAKDQTSFGNSVSNFFSGLWTGFEDIVSTLYHDRKDAIGAVFDQSSSMANTVLNTSTGVVTNVGESLKVYLLAW